MKQLICEMCASQDIIKQDGFFVCQVCGTKYSVEEAKKMMIEGTVDIQGTVKVDNSSFVEKYLANARRAKQKEDWKETERYYNMVEANDPKNIEAIFYSTYAQIKSALLEAETKDKRQGTFNSLIKGVSIIDDNYDNTNENHQKLLVEIMDDLKALKNGIIVPTTHLQGYVKTNAYGSIVDRNQITVNDSLDVTYNMINDVILAYIDSLANIIVEHSSESVKKLFIENINFLSMSSEIHEKVAPYIDGYKTPKQASIEIAKQVKIDAHTRSKEINVQINTLGRTICPLFMSNEDFNSLRDMVREELKKMHPDSTALNGWCYVATCIYGSYDCPEVWTLRRYRDNTLGATWYGRAFIRAYYAISPTLVKWFGKTKWFKKMWKGTLDRMVKNLQDKGIENTPYEDKEW